MAICRIIETGATPEQYDQVRAKLGVNDAPPPGNSLHVAALGEDGKIHVIEVWNSREDADEFGKKVWAIREESGLGGDAPPMTYFDVHKVLQ
jgi:hypothetical protein